MENDKKFDILDFYFFGHSIMGPGIIGKLKNKDVKSVETGVDVKRVYYVNKTKKGYEIESVGKDSPYGKHVQKYREQVTMDGYQKFLSKLSSWEPPKSERKPRTKIDPKVDDVIINSFPSKPPREIAEEVGLDVSVIRSRIQYLKKLGRVSGDARASRRKNNPEILQDEVPENPENDVKVIASEEKQLSTIQRMKILLSVDLARSILSNEKNKDMIPSDVAKKASEITEKIFEIFLS